MFGSMVSGKVIFMQGYMVFRFNLCCLNCASGFPDARMEDMHPRWFQAAKSRFENPACWISEFDRRALRHGWVIDFVKLNLADRTVFSVVQG